MDKSIDILLPYKETFDEDNASAVSITVYNSFLHSKYKNNIKIYGKQIEEPLLKNYKSLKINRIFDLGNNISIAKSYIRLNKKKTSLIEIHNRPKLFHYLKKHTNNPLSLHFHNDPTIMQGSMTLNERLKIAEDSEAVYFVSNYIKNKFCKNFPKKFNNLHVLFNGIERNIKKKPKKEKIILFVGRLVKDKGIKLYLESIKDIIEKYSDWKFYVIGTPKPGYNLNKLSFYLKSKTDKEGSEIVSEIEKLSMQYKNFIYLKFISNKKVQHYMKKASIVVVPSIWNDPCPLTLIEALSNSCAVITSDRGGIPEIVKDNGVIIKNINETKLKKKIVSLMSNKNKLKKYQNLAWKNYDLHLKKIVVIQDSIRSKIFLNKKKYISNIINKKLKILHITNFNDRFDGRLHYNTSKRINNGLIKLGHNVLTLSDRDIIAQNKSIFDIDGSKSLNKKIINNIDNFKPNLVVMGHADNIYLDTINYIKNKNIFICQWFLDPITANGPDFLKNKIRINKFANIIDATFITTHPDAIKFNIKNVFYIPNPCDESFETLNNSLEKKDRDLFFAMSHGVHRGKLKQGKHDDREKFLKSLERKIPNIHCGFFGYKKREPIWSNNFLNQISNYSMALNLSRGKPVKFYSSDRIAQLIGNGLLTFIDEKTELYKLFNRNEAVYYKNVDDLAKKIIYYKKNLNLLKKIASNGKKKYFKKFNSKIVADFIVTKTLGIKNKNQFFWENI